MSARRVSEPASITKPRAAAGARPARRALAEGRFDLCAAYLTAEDRSGGADGRLSLLRAQLAHAEHDFKAAHEAGTIAAQQHPTPGGRLSASALAAHAARELGQTAVADRLFATVRQSVQKGATEVSAFAASLLATDALERGDVAAADAVLAPFLSHSDPDAHISIAAGHVAARRGDHREAGTHFVAALTALDADPEAAADLRAGALEAVAAVAEAGADVRLGRRARKWYETLAWVPSLAHTHVRTVLHLRTIALLEGDLDRAWLDARAATQIAETAADRVAAEVAASASSRLLGDEHAARIQITRAWETIRAHKWAEASEDERLALAEFAVEATFAMPAEARKAISTYQSFRARGAASTRRDRAAAYANFALGRVADSTDERAEAIERYRTALELFEELGDTVRVAVVSSDLYRATRDETYRANLEAALKRSPNAWLLTPASIVDDLGPKAREILARLLVGESAKSTAAELGRSAFTVINHTRRIFEVFEVHSRDELREKCAALGITPATVRAR